MDVEQWGEFLTIGVNGHDHELDAARYAMKHHFVTCKRMNLNILCPLCGQTAGANPMCTTCHNTIQTELELFPAWNDAPREDTKRLCRKCGREWCEALDAYYGKDEEQATLCTKCRK